MTSPQPLATRERNLLFKTAAATPRTVEMLLRNVSPPQLLKRPVQGFSLHEHVWHLADLELHGFQVRFKALLSDDNPSLPNFDGDRAALERDYHRLSLIQACHTFSAIRLQNLWLLSGVKPADWMRRGTQQGVGVVNLVDIFRALAHHDRVHIGEIEALLRGDSAHPTSSTAAA